MSLSLEELGPWGLRSQAEMRRRRRKGVTGAGAELERCWPGHSMGQVGTGGPYPPGGFFPHANILAAFLGLSGPQMRQRTRECSCKLPSPRRDAAPPDLDLLSANREGLTRRVPSSHRPHRSLTPLPSASRTPTAAQEQEN